MVGEMQVVTLYEGPAQWGRVVDRVTYSSSDVATAWRTFVIRDQAELDFYRSLERRSPYYPGDRPRLRGINEVDYSPAGYRDGNYDDWARNEDSALLGVPVSRFATPLAPNVSVFNDSAVRGDFELELGRVKNGNFATVGEIVDVPYMRLCTDESSYRPLEGLRPTLSILDASAILELATTSRMDLTAGQSEPIGGAGWRGVSAAGYLAFLFTGAEPPELGPNEELVAYYARDPAEAIWRWDIEDGLEDGVYNLYVFVGGGLSGHPDTRPV